MPSGRACDHGRVTDEPEDLDEALHDAHRASSNSAVMLAISIAFGAVALADPGRIPVWLVSAWFVIVIPLTLYLMFMFRRRYRHLLDSGAARHNDGREGYRR
ncbi:hypothetical protein GCM10027413_14420 [Conyzicola nivalis]|uniref:Uncharacterized protein n=1 Tax=Conyzicola nivalis TaxID=1477021 RepID=A0A916SHA4_9MICO|nr:hypothetical protein GCM10010979_12200 [Conyzicola nivalis]